MHNQSDIYTKDQYYEAIIQLRPKSEEIIKFIENQISKRKDVFISKIVEKKFGIDFYITSQRFARSLGKKIKDNFMGELKITRSLHTRNRQTSRDVYRGTVLFRVKEDNE